MKDLGKFLQTKNPDASAIDLSNFGLFEIPREIFRFEDLKILRLNNNEIKSIPNEILSLEKLEIIELGFNKIDCIPRNLFQLKNLRELYLDRNLLSGSKSTIYECNSLELLDLSNNEISFLDNLSLSNLRVLILDNNKLKQIPAFLIKSYLLEEIYISGNDLHLPISKDNFSDKVKLIDLQGNKINEINFNIIEIKNLETLYLRDNPLTCFPQSLRNDLNFEDNLERIRFFSYSQKQGEDLLFQVKVLILGSGGVGKTTLAKKLINPSYKVPCDEEQTPGIRLQPYTFKYDNNHQILANIWDFGGQEIYYPTHQFFLSNNSMYLIVNDNRQNDTDFDYWLKLISDFASNSPVIIILNQKSSIPVFIDEFNYKQKYSNIKEILKVNFSNNDGLNNLTLRIQASIVNLPKIGKQIPKNWKNVKNVVENETELNYISFDQFEKICNNCNIYEQTEILDVSEFLHEIGCILHFQKDIKLFNMIVLNPKWITEAVYSILNSNQVIKNKGVFGIAEFSEILRTNNYPISQYQNIISLMVAFELIYSLNEDLYVIPFLMEIKPPIYSLPKNETIIYKYKYAYIPKGLINRLSVKFNKLIKDSIIWKFGLVIERNGTFAEIILNQQSMEIIITIEGNVKLGLLTYIKTHFEDLHAALNVKEVFELIPCSCSECKTGESYFFKITNLRKAWYKNIEHIQCQKSFDNIPLKTLMEQYSTIGLSTIDFLTKDKNIEKAKKCIENGEILNAIVLVKEYYNFLKNNDKTNELLLLTNRFKRLEKEKLKGTKDKYSIDLELNKICESLLKIVD